ncbi:2-oxoacid ferredoxin oxidoreductase [Pseudomonas sp. NPDC090202]|uniref:2-oxoacid ferredoxin oxidoreductase n=1 Tax=unclassified Pseudomonas TaxID=196821 RepID=UPI003812E5A4
MKHWVGALALVVLAGCMSLDRTRSAGPVKVYSSQKPAVAVAECIKVTWANVQLFGDVADVFMDKGKPGEFTVYTTEGEYFADVAGKGGATSVSFYAKPGAKVVDKRGAVLATCL